MPKGLRAVSRVVEHHFLVYRRTWRGTITSTVLNPLLYLAAMGVGLGTFVDQASQGGFASVPYISFLAPGLLAAQAMNTATFESTYPVMSGIRWLKTYVAMVASPIGPGNVALGQLTWVGLRVTFGALVFACVIVLFRAAEPAAAAAMVPAAVLTGLAFAAPIQAFAATAKSDNPFSALFRFVITPMFIFSGVFFPITQLPDLIEWIAYVTPLWNGVALARAIGLGHLDVPLAILNVSVLLAYIAVGVWASVRTFRQRLAE